MVKLQQQASNENSPRIGTHVVTPSYTTRERIGGLSRSSGEEWCTDRHTCDDRRVSSVNTGRTTKTCSFNEVDFQTGGEKLHARSGATALRTYSLNKPPVSRNGHLLHESSSSSSSSTTLSQMLKEFNRSELSNTNNTQKGAALPPCEGDRISSTVLQTKGSKGHLMERQEVLLDRLQPPEGALSADECNGLTELLWSSNVQPSLSWKQGFYFNEESSFRLGLIQRYGGPCGAIVAIQGHIVAELWAQRHSTESITPCFEFETNADRDEILMDGLTTVLLQAAGVPPIGDVSSRRRVSIVYSTRHNTEALEFDELLTYCCKRDIKPTRKEIKECLLQVLAQYKQEEGWGLVLFLLSILLTKTVHNIRDEMDDSEMCLIGNHSYCSQELVNLLITGKATTNTFDGNKSFDEEGSYLLKGIQRRSRLGLLTLLEWNNYVEVGSFLKCPEFPVWIVCAESHFTVLFCLDTILPKTDKGFELLHYDSLSLQAEPTRLQITRCPHGGLSKKLENQEMDASNVTCLEYVIQTKWNDAMVSIKN